MKEELLGTHEETPVQTKLYCKRWHVLAIFSVQTMLNAVIWISFAPIANLVQAYYDVSATAVNMCSLSFMILYLPGTMLASSVIERRGLRGGIVLGAMMNAVAAVVRYSSTLIVSNSDASGTSISVRHGAFGLLLFGQCIGALAQPIFTNAPVRVASEWFALAERDVATTIAALSNPLGNALGQIVPTLLVSMVAGASNDDDVSGSTTSSVRGMSHLLLLEAAVAAVAAVWVWFGFAGTPTLPPSASAASQRLRRQLRCERWQHQRERLASGDDVARSPGTVYAAFVDASAEGLRDDISNLLRDSNFRILLGAFGVGLGLFNALLTLVEQLLKPAGYTSDDSGLFGAVLIGVGTVGAGVAGAVLDATHAYRPVLKTGFIVAEISTVFAFLVMRPGQRTLLLVAGGAMGLAMMPLYPVTLECAVECTYPISEENSSGLLLLVGNLTGMLFTFILSALIDLQPHYTTIFTPAAIFFVGVMTCCTLTVLRYNGSYKRLNAENNAASGY